MSIDYFEKGVVFYCPIHYNKLRYKGASSTRNKIEGGKSDVQCTACSSSIEPDGMYYSCSLCQGSKDKTEKTINNGFPLCLDCFNFNFPNHHPHKGSCFRLKYVNSEDNTISDSSNADPEPASPYPPTGKAINSFGKHSVSADKNSKIDKKSGPICSYCRVFVGKSWRSGFGNMVLCETCYSDSNELYRNNNLDSVNITKVKNQIQGFNSGALLEKAHKETNEPENIFESSFNVASKKNFNFNSEISKLGGIGGYATNVNDYSHTPYFTRDSCLPQSDVSDFKKLPASIKSSLVSTVTSLGQLSSYKPTKSMLWSLPVSTTYFGIYGRAPRWASHLGTDYHGTWLPQSVRRSLIRFTNRFDMVLSNFLGRGTDAIESFLMGRKCIGVDINPLAVNLSMRNCSFTVSSNNDILGGLKEAKPENMTLAKLKPLLFNGDSRDLKAITGPQAQYYFNSNKKDEHAEIFDFVLSHPPYKDCVGYSSYINGDLSGFPDPVVFQKEMSKVISETYRLLKMNHFITCGIGDNRSERFYIPVGFQLLRTYIDNGFDINELIVKRQRHCQAYGLGTYLCLQYNFLVFTHEYIVTFRKVPKQRQQSRQPLLHSCCNEKSDNCSYYTLLPNYRLAKLFSYSRIANLNIKEVCSSFGFDLETSKMKVEPLSMDREKVALETVWQIKVDENSGKGKEYNFKNLLVIKLVQRFGHDHTNWEYLDLSIPQDEHIESASQLQTANKKDVQLLLEAQKDPAVADSIQNHDDSEDSDTSQGEVDTDEEHKEDQANSESYEQKRIKQIEENQKRLLSLGLISEFGIFNNEDLYSESLLLFDQRKENVKENIILEKYYQTESNILDKDSNFNSDESYDSKEGSDKNETQTLSTSSSAVPSKNLEVDKFLKNKKRRSLGKPALEQEKPSPVPISLIVIPHVETTSMFTKLDPSSSLFAGWTNDTCFECRKSNFAKTVVDNYRMLLVQMVLQSYDKLAINGLIAIGIQDIRDPINQELWPIGLLLTEDIGYAISSEYLKLKELIIAVPAGYENAKESSQYRVNGKRSKVDLDNLKVECILGVPNKNIDHIPIVHTYYLVYTKIK